MRVLSFSLASVGFLFCVAAGAAVLGNIDKIRSADRQLQQEAERAILNQRTRTIQELVSAVQDPEMQKQNPDGVAAAIRLLGKVRASEAAQLLANMITFAEPGEELPSRPPSPENRRPAVAALVEIGIPALFAVLRATAAGKGGYIELSCAASVITQVIGKRAALGYVTSQARFEPNPRYQGNLQALARLIESQYWGADPYDPATYERQK